jgi:large subunit ribosomal protein L21
MYAIVKTGSKQYRVEKGSIIDVELLTGEKGDAVTLDQVLFLKDDKNSTIGAPLIAGASVKAEIQDQVKDKKLIVFKYKRRKNCRTKNGHRQKLTRIKVTDIAQGGN